MIMDMRKDDAGVSEAIGFILVFTIVILGISIVTLYGYPALADARISSDEKIMEQNMIVLQNDLKILTRSNVPYRDTTIGVSGGSIFVTNSTEAAAVGGEDFTLTFYNTTSSATEIKTYYPGSLEYYSDDGTAVVSVANGAVVKRQQDQSGSVMVSDPRWFYDETEDTLVIFMTSLNSTQPMSLGGIGTIQMGMLTPPVIRDFDYTSTGTREVVIDYNAAVDDDYSRAWNAYLTADSTVGFTEDSPNVYKKDVGRLVIKEYTVEILGI